MSKKNNETSASISKTKSDRLSPSAFMRNLRPEYYSDTEDRVSYTLDRATFECFLENLTARNETHEFEIFCRKLCERTICPHLRPNTGPDGGGDGKTDTETIKVAEEIATLSYIGEPNGGKERWAFAFSAKEKWTDKVRSDVKGIVGTGRKYDHIYCITSRFAKAKTRADLEQKLEEQYGIPVTILDRTWIIEQIIDHDRVDIAFHYLNVGQENTDTLSLGPIDYSRAQQLDEIEKSMADPTAFEGMEYQRVIEALVAAKLSRNLERPRTETDGRFGRAIRFAEQDGDFRQKLAAQYEYLWTAYWWFDDLSLLLAKYDEFETLALQASHIRNLELLTNLLQLLFNSVLHDLVSREDCRLDECAEKVRTALQKMVDEPNRPNHSLEARCALLLLRLNMAMVNRDHSDLSAIWKGFREILDQANGLGEFPAQRIAQLIELAGNVAGNNPEYNELIERLAVFIGERDSEGRAGIMLLNRADKLELDDHFDIIRFAGRATTRLTKKEYTSELAHALQLLTIAYRKAGLLWAARASCIFVASSLIIEAEEDGQIPVSFVPTMEIFAWISLELGHLPDALFAIQMLNGAISMLPLTDESKKKVQAHRQELDFALGSILLNASNADIARLEYMPDLLEGLNLFTARMSLLYVLGHEETLLTDGSVPEPDTINNLREMMNMLASQPTAKQATTKFVFNEPPETLETNIMGMRIEIMAMSATDETMCLAELTAAALEAFFATTLQQDIIPHAEQFTIRVSISDKVYKPSFTVDALSTVGELVWPTGLVLYNFSNQELLRELLIDVVSNVLSRNFMMNDAKAFFETLFADDGVQERIAIMMAVGNSYHRFAQRNLTRLDNWRDEMTTKFDKRARPAIDNTLLSKASEPKKAEPREIKHKRPKVDSHRKVKVHSIIDVHAWDQAKWRGVGYLRFDPEYPPVLALLFENEEAARAIFSRWRERVGPADHNNLIRVAIIRRHSPSNPNHYIVQVASTPPKLDEMESGQSFILASRCLENTPDNDVNLSRFLHDYEKMGAYYIAAGIIPEDGEFICLQDLTILKRELSVKRAEEIQELDVEAMALRSTLDREKTPEEL
jgi:hypothetical protein